MFFALLSPAVLFADQPQGDPGQALMFPIMLMGLFLLFWLFLIRPAQRQQREKEAALLANLEKNDRILTSGGIYGTIVNVVGDQDEITVKVDDNVKLKMTKASVIRNLTKEEKAREADAAAGKGAAK
jgi:preprotein translocase subunit YajC